MMLGGWPLFFHFILRQLCLLSHDFCKQQNTKIKKKLFAFWMTYFYLLSNFASNVNPNIYSFDGTCIINLHAHSFYCTAFVLYLLIDQKKYNYYGKACNVGWIVYEKNPMSCGEGWKENPDFIVETRQIKCRNFILCALYYVVWAY